MSYNIIFCIETFNIGGGATIALMSLIKNNPDIKDYVIFCRNIIRNEKSLEGKIIVGKGNDIITFFQREKFDLIHWFKANGNCLFEDLIKEMCKYEWKIPILTTICQKPSCKSLLLSPCEILYSNHLVFIDKAAYNDALFQFIPNSKKSMIYFGFGQELLEIIDKVRKNTPYIKTNQIIYGRGSSLNKCPKDMFDVFDKINHPKSFIIVGGGKKQWIIREINKRKMYDVKLIDNLRYEEWIKVLNSFDVFLYYLPLKAYSSIDGTLGEAMLLQKPVIYYGPEAPKERLIHGYNSLIANNKEEISVLCNKLAKDEEMRLQLGLKARETTLENFSIERTIDAYNILYNKLLTKKEFIHFQEEAAERFVEIIPEIDVPAHSLAFSHYKPELGSKEYGMDHLNLSHPEVYSFVDALFKEYLDGENPVFRGPKVHIGTDEYSNKKKEVVEQFRAFTDHYIKYVEGFGKQACVWGALTHAAGETPVKSDNVIMYAWYNGFANPKDMVQQGYNLISIPDGPSMSTVPTAFWPVCPSTTP